MKPMLAPWVLILLLLVNLESAFGQPSPPAHPDLGSRRQLELETERPTGSTAPRGVLESGLIRELNLARPRTELRNVYDVVRQHRGVVFVETFDGYLVPYKATAQGDYERLTRNANGRWHLDGSKVEISPGSTIDIGCPECEAAPGASPTGNVPVVRMKTGGVTGKTSKKGGGSTGGSSTDSSSTGGSSTGDGSTDGSSLCCCRSLDGAYRALDRSRCHLSCSNDSKCPGIVELRQAEALEAEIRKLEALRNKEQH